MNKTFSLSSTLMKDGEVRLTYNEHQLLVKFEVLGELGPKRLTHMLEYLPRNIPELEKFKGITKTMIVKEIFEEITFDMLWNLCDDKKRSTKELSRDIFNKMSVVHQRKAFYYWPKYLKSIPPGIARKYVETYLRSKIYLNED